MRDPIAIVVDRRPRSIGGIREIAHEERGADRAALRREARRRVPHAIFVLPHIAHDIVPVGCRIIVADRSEEHTSELQSLMRISYAVFCLKKKKKHTSSTIWNHI